jgi:hypothetical protein
MTDPPPKPLDYATPTPRPSEHKVRPKLVVAIVIAICWIVVLVCGIYAILYLWDFPPDQQ